MAGVSAFTDEEQIRTASVVGIILAFDEAKGEHMPRLSKTEPLSVRKALEQLRDGPVTLGDLAQNGKLLWVYCDVAQGGCGHERDVDPTSLGLPMATPVPDLGRRHLKCSRCGSKAIVTRPELYPGGVKAWRAAGKR